MIHRQLSCGVLGILLIASVGIAQTPPDSPKPSDERRPGARERGPRREPPFARIGDVKVQLAMLTEKLELDEAQQTEITKILEARNEKVRELREQTERSPEEVEAMRALREEMDAAMKANDRERMEVLRKKADQMYREREERNAPARQKLLETEKALHDDIVATLRPEQVEKFEEVWKQRMVRPGGREGPVRNPRALKSIVEGLKDLSDEQKETIDGLFAAFRESVQRRPERPEGQERPSRADREAREKDMQEKTEKLFNDVIAVLTPEQKAKVEEALRGLSRPGTRGEGREGRGGRQGRPGRTAPDQPDENRPQPGI